MRYLLILIAAAAAGLLFWFCKSSKYSSDKLPENQLRWGSGGGITGKETVYTLLENGQIFKSAAMKNDTAEVDGPRKKVAKALFLRAAEMGLAKLDFNHPGNIYRFVELANAEGVQRVAWGDPKYPADPAVEALYQALNKLIAE
jgi:hypothetical protein